MDASAKPATQTVVQHPKTAPSLLNVFGSFFGLGLTAFGGPAMVTYIRQMALERKHWVDADEFDRGVALCQAIPGATAMQTAAYVGLRVRGVSGAAASFAGFGLPAFVLMMMVAAAYSQSHQLPLVLSAFSGLRAIVVALVANAAVSFGKHSLQQWRHTIIATLAAVLLALNVNPFVVIVSAGLLAMAILPAVKIPAQPITTRPVLDNDRIVILLLVAAGVIFLALWLTERRLFEVAAMMFRIDLFAFGGGFSSVPLMCHEAVEVHHWVNNATLLDGIVLGQITPGPIVITATFIGYLFAGFAGGVTATVAVFLPSFLILILTAPYFERLQGSRVFNKIIAGALCSFVGLLLVVTARFAQSVRWDAVHLLLATGGFLALKWKVNVLWVVLTGAALSIALCR